jgi:enterochelin esterase family protein
MKPVSFALLVFLGAQLRSQQPVTAAFFRLRGTDTLSIERFVRGGDSVAGEVFQGTQIVRYKLELRPDGLPDRVEFTAVGYGVQTGQLGFTQTHVDGQRSKRDATNSVDLQTASLVFPMFVESTALLEQIVRSAPSHNTIARVPVVRPLAAGIIVDTLVLRRLPHDSVLLELTEGDLRFAITRDGNVGGGTGFAGNERIARGPVPSVWPPAQPRQAAAREPRIVSPELREDRTVTLRVRAPHARVVTVHGLGDFMFDRRLARDSTGLWSITVGPLRPNIYSYRFAIDSVEVPDPLNASTNSAKWSVVEVPDTAAAWSIRDVPHGAVSTIWYRSRSLGGVTRAVTVYTPPGYETSRDSLPALYLLHGLGGTEDATTDSRTNFILDNLLADRKVVPMIVVAPFGEARASTKLGIANNQATPGVNFYDDVLRDVIPLVEQRYRAKRSADSRAVAGGSQGAADALFGLGLPNLDVFHWIGGFSVGAPFRPGGTVDRFVTSLDASAVNRQARLVWFSCGRDDPFYAANEALSAAMKARGIKHTFVRSEGYHLNGFQTAFPEFVPLLFR